MSWWRTSNEKSYVVYVVNSRGDPPAQYRLRIVEKRHKTSSTGGFDP